ncbi:MAG: hypothetical protein M1834_006762 [Cirrosporium novae-zelandiae]|nr:MAG: hypothetical protein M1834_006762 [Cirrosporium novae-zelandiae]
MKCIFLQVLSLVLGTTAYTLLSNKTLASLPGSGSDFDIHNGAILAPILQPRVPGTPGAEVVRNHLVDFFRTHLPSWTITFQNSTSKTPATGNSDIPFVNIIASRDPPWTQPGDVGRLTMVAHYDSLNLKDFVGATDSAAPCAMLMHAARSVDAALTEKWSAMGAEDEGFLDLDDAKGIQIILLDGEEAFLKWTADDSLYGARSLAEEWDQEFHPAMSTYKTELSSISLFVLLDLLGSKDPVVPSYYKMTHWAYQKMANIEYRLRELGLFKSSPNYPLKQRDVENEAAPRKSQREPYFLTEADKVDEQWLGGMIQDDHIPFLRRGVEILHIIPSRFPPVWHKVKDDGAHLDLDTVEDWALLTTAFIGEWMNLEGYLGTKPIDVDNPNHSLWARSTDELLDDV